MSSADMHATLPIGMRMHPYKRRINICAKPWCGILVRIRAGIYDTDSLTMGPVDCCIQSSLEGA